MAQPLDRFTNLFTTSVNQLGGIDGVTNPVTFVVLSATGAPNGPFRILIDNEMLQVTAGFGTTTWTARRAVDSTSIASHLNTASITHIVTAYEANSFVQMYNPMAYLGVGDGVTDDTSAFQGALNDAHVNGAPVYIPTASYSIQSALTTYANTVFITSGAVFSGAGASSVSPVINFKLDGTLLGVMVRASGLSGSTASARWVGATSTGAPVSGTYLQGDWITTLDGKIFICTVAGTPGTWAQPAPALTFGANGDIQPLSGSASAGSSGKVADAQHVHPTTGVQTWTGLQTFSGGIALGSSSLTKTRNSIDNVPLLGTATGTANGVQIWITSTDPTTSANNGDVWFDG